MLPDRGERQEHAAAGEDCGASQEGRGARAVGERAAEKGSRRRQQRATLRSAE